MVTRYSDDKKAPRQEESDRPGQRFDKEKEPADVAHPEGVASSASAEGGTVFTVIAPGLQFGYSFCPMLPATSSDLWSASTPFPCAGVTLFVGSDGELLHRCRCRSSRSSR